MERVTLRPSYLSALAKAAGSDFRCTVAKKDGAIVGFVTSVKDGDTAVGYYIGDYRELAATGVGLYLRLLHALRRQPAGEAARESVARARGFVDVLDRIGRAGEELTDCCCY